MKRSLADSTHIFKHVQGKKNETLKNTKNKACPFTLKWFRFSLWYYCQAQRWRNNVSSALLSCPTRIRQKFQRRFSLQTILVRPVKIVLRRLTSRGRFQVLLIQWRKSVPVVQIMAATRLLTQLKVRLCRANKSKKISGTKPYGSSFENVVDHYIERGCQSDLPKYLKDKVKV